MQNNEMDRIEKEYSCYFNNYRNDYYNRSKNNPNSPFYNEIMDGSYKDKHSFINIKSRDKALDKTYANHCHNGRYDAVCKDFAHNKIKGRCQESAKYFHDKSINEVNPKKIEEYQTKSEMYNEMARKAKMVQDHRVIVKEKMPAQERSR